MAEAEPEKRWGKPASGKSTVMGLAILVLLGLVGWLLAERNARSFALVYEEGQLSVKKGILFPAGRQAFKTDDPALAQAYAPLRPPPGARVDQELSFEDRAGLDQALYDLLARWAREDIASEKPEQVERALEWLGRAEKLAGISAAQREDLRQLRAESGYFEARQLLDRAAELLRQARERLRLTASSSSSHAGAAGQVLRQVEPLPDALYAAARVFGQPAPPAASPAPSPTPAASPAPAGAAR